MHAVFIFAAIISSALAFGPHTVKLITKTTSPPIDCNGRPSDFTVQFCEYKPHKLFKHPHYPKWFIDCFSKTCQRCGAHNVLELNEDCQMCLGPGAKCPKALPKPQEIVCHDDGCPFCPEHSESQNGGYTHHQNPQNFCQCVWGYPRCMPCPCQQVFDRKKGCCVQSREKGRKCPHQ